VPQYGDEQKDAGNKSSIETAGDRKILYWYDPMHPAYKSDKPGIAPDCGMTLVPKYAEENMNMAKMPAGTVTITPEKQQLIGVRTGTVERQSLHRTVRTTRRPAPPCWSAT
jgi:Cu(I)/Ag(I) efflux system membrane fusion protein